QEDHRATHILSESNAPVAPSQPPRFARSTLLGAARCQLRTEKRAAPRGVVPAVYLVPWQTPSARSGRNRRATVPRSFGRRTEVGGGLAARSGCGVGVFLSDRFCCVCVRL